MAYQQLIGVYNAEGSILGEVRYVVGKLTGTRECALCDISHRFAWEKGSFSAFKDNFPIPFFSRHLDELEPEQLALARGRTPCILGLNNDSWQVVATSQNLKECDSSVAKFSELMYSLI